MSGYTTRENGRGVCSKCRGDVPTSATICPFCRSPLNQEMSFGEIFLLGCVLAVFWVGLMIFNFIAELFS